MNQNKTVVAILGASGLLGGAMHYTADEDGAAPTVQAQQVDVVEALKEAIAQINIPEQKEVDLSPLSEQISQLRKDLQPGQGKPAASSSWTGARIYVPSNPDVVMAGRCWCVPCNALAQKLLEAEKKSKWLVGDSLSDDWVFIKSPRGPYPRIEYWKDGRIIEETTWSRVEGNMQLLFRKHPESKNYGKPIVQTSTQTLIQNEGWTTAPASVLQDWKTVPVNRWVNGEYITSVQYGPEVVTSVQYGEPYAVPQQQPQGIFDNLPQVRHQSSGFGVFGLPLMNSYSTVICPPGQD